MNKQMKIGFFGVKGWEREIIEKEISKLDVFGIGIFEKEVQDDIKLASEYEVLSVFIYSEINKKVLDKFDINKNVKEYEKLYEREVGRRK